MITREAVLNVKKMVSSDLDEMEKFRQTVEKSEGMGSLIVLTQIHDGMASQRKRMDVLNELEELVKLDEGMWKLSLHGYRSLTLRLVRKLIKLRIALLARKAGVKKKKQV